jgi:nitrite reductase/ring-hydroxylating ferredoxin subunit
MLRPGLLLMGIFLLISCSKDDSSRIPDVFIDYHISLQEFQIKKNADGVLLVGNQGVAGLIIYHRADGAYVAFDRCSSVEPEKKCVVVPDAGGLTVTDPCSQAKFSLYDGAPVKAPAQRSLKQYQVVVTSFEIVVSN